MSARQLPQWNRTYDVALAGERSVTVSLKGHRRKSRINPTHTNDAPADGRLHAAARRKTEDGRRTADGGPHRTSSVYFLIRNS